MPMFLTPKPRQFHYEPRFYDPKKEKLDTLMATYADAAPNDKPAAMSDNADASAAGDDLAYFEARVHEIDQKERHQAAKMTWQDLFRKRSMPTFDYKPRFSSDTTAEEASPKHPPVKIRRRFETENNIDLQPVPAGKIMLYALLACLLLYWIIF